MANFVIMTTGLGVLQAQEAVDLLDLGDRVGILKIGTIWPLPANLIKRHLKQADRVLFVEEIDPFLEDHVKVLYAENGRELGPVRFYGKNTGDIYGKGGPGVGEMNTDIIVDALRRIFKMREPPKDPTMTSTRDYAVGLVIPREVSFCQGCPHRASFLTIKAALQLDGREGFVVGDIGCYGLAAGATGFNQIKALHCMGSGMGNLSGFSKLSSFGLNQPAVAVVGDSTFFHAGLPALVNARFNNATALFVVLDNQVTAMTGFQVNPATPQMGSGEPRDPIAIENITRALDIKTTVLDPAEDVRKAIEVLYHELQEDGVKVVVFRRSCSMIDRGEEGLDRLPVAVVDPDKCIGETCGCDRFCSRVLACPAIQHDDKKDRASIQEDLCNGCGLCIQLCPRKAISLVDNGERREL
jgi:indolepyruvate ferredoxin oxidoreductase alpha subunit